MKYFLASQVIASIGWTMGVNAGLASHLTCSICWAVDYAKNKYTTTSELSR